MLNHKLQFMVNCSYFACKYTLHNLQNHKMIQYQPESLSQNRNVADFFFPPPLRCSLSLKNGNSTNLTHQSHSTSHERERSACGCSCALSCGSCGDLTPVMSSGLSGHVKAETLFDRAGRPRRRDISALRRIDSDHSFVSSFLKSPSQLTRERF